MADKSVARKRVKQPNFISRFFRETIGELRKVSWPSRREALRLTQVVVIVMIITGVILGALDLLFTRLFALLLG